MVGHIIGGSSRLIMDWRRGSALHHSPWCQAGFDGDILQLHAHNEIWSEWDLWQLELEQFATSGQWVSRDKLWWKES